MINDDLKYIFHPCSQMKDYEQNLPLIPIKSGEVAYLYDFDGNRYIDVICVIKESINSLEGR